ncbi:MULTISPECIES: DUF2000 domain-containing protein [Bacillus]|nr:MULTISPECIES: DUF2000 domain-containing protein [Bacillus]MED1095949.1 DUF2000 domain-containing protein [Bacillus capparidis]
MRRRSCKTYEEYTAKLQNQAKTDYQHFGLDIYGEKKKVNRLTGSFSLLR